MTTVLAKSIRHKSCNISLLSVNKKDEDNKAATNIEKAEILAENFEKLHTLTKYMKHAEADRCATGRRKIYLIKPYKIWLAAHKCKIRKAPGENKIKNIVLKTFASKGLNF